jgi:Lon protease-like protein
LRVPIFPLNAVLFPGGLLPLRVFEVRYVDMTRDRLKRDEPFGVCLIREGSEVGAPAVPEKIGCLAKILDWDMREQGILNLKTRGEQRFRILDRETGPQGLVTADVELISPDATIPLPAKFAACARLLEMVVLDQGNSVFAEPHAFNDAAWVSYRLTEILPVPLVAKQKLLELTDSLARLSILQRFLESRGLAADKAEPGAT